MNFCVICIVLYSWVILYGGYLSGAGPVSRKAYLKQCDLPTLKNGVTRLRQKGRLIKFQCYKSYTLIGNIYAGCVGGKWDTQFPICAKAGCKTVESRDNGFIILQRRGLMASLFCEEHYKVAGVQTAYCDGSNWDRPIGNCRSTTENLKWCDFEVDDICGWTHDNTHDFEWKRVVGSDNLKRYRTGPQRDHTTMIPNAGHYMLVESINQLPDDRARLISPVYSRNLTNNGCFRFYYHMYGATVGTLRVYVKPMSVSIDKVLDDPSYYMWFEVAGNRGNLWHENVLHFRQIDDEFQIVFEGTAGSSHLSDIAIDDVALLDPEQCRQIKGQDNDEDTSTEQGQLIFDVQSCKNRCEEKVAVNESVISTQQGLIKTCDCHPDCELTQTCCTDYRTICVFGVSYSEGDDDDVEYSTKPPLEFMTARKTIPIATTLRQLVTTPILRHTPYFATSPIAGKPETTELTTVVDVTSASSSEPHQSPTTVAIFYNRETTLPTTPIPSYNGDMSFAFLSTPEDSWDTFENSTWHMYEVIPPSNEWQIQASLAKSRAWIPAWVVILLGVCVTGGILSLLSFIILYYRRHYGPGNYKKNSESATSNVNEEFSEVRYLTCDEHLDFTLQTPETINCTQKL